LLNRCAGGLIILCFAYFYSNIENLVLRARSEKIGCAVNICHGMMEYWNVGMLGLAEWDLFL
jgi:hypothetical protein